jgi:hypothetical protein
LIAALKAGLGTAGDQGYWRAVRDSELAKSKGGQANACTLARASARLGQRREALAWLERSFRDRDGWLVYLNADANFDDLRGDTHFKDLVARIGLPAAQ